MTCRGSDPARVVQRHGVQRRGGQRTDCLICGASGSWWSAPHAIQSGGASASVAGRGNPLQPYGRSRTPARRHVPFFADSISGSQFRNHAFPGQAARGDSPRHASCQGRSCHGQCSDAAGADAQACAKGGFVSEDETRRSDVRHRALGSTLPDLVRDRMSTNEAPHQVALASATGSQTDTSPTSRSRFMPRREYREYLRASRRRQARPDVVGARSNFLAGPQRWAGKTRSSRLSPSIVRP